jgi:opacity protein-like surface antigen
MKNSKMELVKKTIFLMICAFIMSLSMNAQEQPRPKNNFSVGGGFSAPLVTSDNVSGNYSSNGSNFSVNYSREIFSKNKSYWTVGLKYINTSSPYAMLNYDLTSMNLSSPSSLGEWDGTVDDFKMSAYLVGLNYNNYISKNKKLSSFLNINIGSASLTSPSQKFSSSKGYFIEVKEVKNNNITYSTSAGFSYNLVKNLALSVEVEYLKSSFYFENQELVFSGGGSEKVDPYTISYSALNFNAGVVLKL